MEFISDPGKFVEKEQLYISVRQSEGRIYTDEELMNLPEIGAAHRHYNEWIYRKASFLRFKDHLLREYNRERLNILDIGCGNGWMSKQLNLLGHNVTAIDLNAEELTQAERVFGTSDSLKWLYADIFDPAFSGEQYHVIILGASCQYFPDLGALTTRLKALLRKGGEIHLIDSMFYSRKELPDAIQRSLDYYTRLGYPQMHSFYYHHTKDEIEQIGYKRKFPSPFSVFSSGNSPEWRVLHC